MNIYVIRKTHSEWLFQNTTHVSKKKLIENILLELVVKQKNNKELALLML